MKFEIEMKFTLSSHQCLRFGTFFIPQKSAIIFYSFHSSENVFVIFFILFFDVFCLICRNLLHVISQLYLTLVLSSAICSLSLHVLNAVVHLHVVAPLNFLNSALKKIV